MKAYSHVNKTFTVEPPFHTIVFLQGLLYASFSAVGKLLNIHVTGRQQNWRKTKKNKVIDINAS